jgi:pilus assembly protein CpaC
MRSFHYLTIVVFLAACALPSFGAEPQKKMIEIAVEVTEINNTKADQLGIKWTDTLETGEIAWQQTGRVVPAAVATSALPEVPSIISVGDWARYTPLTATLQALTQSGAANILSKPKIVTLCGTAAEFLVGGQFPVVATGVGGGTIEWKEYGIKTEVTPDIDGDFITLKLKNEVSRLDWSNAVSGYPAITTRKAMSNVRLKSGQTLTLAGMIETTKNDQTTGVPILSDIPILGNLFKEKNVSETKTSILIFVTPKIVE